MTHQETSERAQEMRSHLTAELEIDPKRTAVMAIDMHRGHLDASIATMPVTPDVAAAVVSSAARLLAATRACGIPTAYLVMTNREINGASEYMRNPWWKAVEKVRMKLTPDLPSTIHRHNLVGSPQTQVMPELAPIDGDYVVRSKHRLSSFLDTDLEGWLRGHGASTLLLMGINTNTCVQCAAFEAFNRDFATVVVEDCVNSMYGPDLHRFGLENVIRCLGWVLTVDEVVGKLDGGEAAVDHEMDAVDHVRG